MFVSIAGVSERDIDLLMLEEFLASEEFRLWFAALVLGPEAAISSLVDARRSVTQSSGESDLEVGLLGAHGEQIRLLIENKVNAALQPQQAERYRLRGNAYMVSGACSSYRTVLVAPERYFGPSRATKGFDARVTYESVLQWFQGAQALGTRREYKVALLQSAIEKGILGYQTVEDQTVTDFWHLYWLLARERGARLAMDRPSGKPSGSDWIWFRPAALPPGTRLVHKLYKGWVDLQFSGAGQRVNDLYHAARHYLRADMKVTRAGRSAVVRLVVPTVDRSQPFRQQEEAVLAGVDAALVLLQWFEAHRVHIPWTDRS